MKQKNFYNIFNALYDEVQDILEITQKEALYSLLFGNIYSLINDDLYDYDNIRKITSGNGTIHKKVLKVLYTDTGFEQFRINIETVCLPALENKQDFVNEALRIFQSDESIPVTIKDSIAEGASDESDYALSRTIAAIMLCLDYSDYIAAKGKGAFFDTNFMHLKSKKPLPVYPRFVTETPNAAVNNLIGRTDDLEKLNNSIFSGSGKIMLSAVGGLGKTELVKKFVYDISQREVTLTGISHIAWITYNNDDICFSIRKAMSIDCEPGKEWQTIQEEVQKYNGGLLLVIDNIEHSDKDEYLKKLSSLQCKIIVTSRQKTLFGFSDIIYLQPLEMADCRELFYYHYQFQERDNEMLNNIIELTAKLTIMIVFIAKAAYLEGFSLRDLYAVLVEKGFKLSEEDVSCEHEKTQNDETIIKQMCILFSIVKYSEQDKILLTFISVIPNLRFDFTKAKKWFKVKKNSSLMKLYNTGILEHITDNRTHIYWIHSVIAAAIREQQKTILYDVTSPFVHELSEELEYGDSWGKAYQKFDLIPFSWSIADLLDNSWENESDSTFLIRLYYVCFEASNYSLCRKLMDRAIEIDLKLDEKGSLIRDYRNYAELMLRLDLIEESLHNLDIAKKLMEELDPEHLDKKEWAFLWHEYGNVYYRSGIPSKALDYYTEALELDKQISDLPAHELSTDYSSIALIYQMQGDLSSAYEMIKYAIEIDTRDDDNSESIMNNYYLANICMDLVSNGYTEYSAEASEQYKLVVDFREKYSGRFSNDLADVYLEFSNYLYQIGENEKSLFYSNKACKIYRYLYGDESYHVLQCLGNEALIAEDEGDLDNAIKMYSEIMDYTENMANLPISDLCKDYQNYAVLLEQADRYDESNQYFQKCIDLLIEHFGEDSPKLAESYIGQANCNMGLENYSEAIHNLEKVKNLSTDDPLLMRIVYHKQGTCYAFMEKYEQAISRLKQALEIKDTNDSDFSTGYILVDISTVYYHMNRHDEAHDYKERAYNYLEEHYDSDLDSYVHTLDIFEDKK